MPSSSENEAISCPSTEIENRAAVLSGGADAPCDVAVQAPTAATVSSRPTNSAKRGLFGLIVSPLLTVERMGAATWVDLSAGSITTLFREPGTGQRRSGVDENTLSSA